MIEAEVKYKGTGIEWMPEVPEHWQLLRVKNLFTEIDKRSVSGKEDLLSVSQYTGVTFRKDGFEEGREITNAKTLEGYKIVEQGDLVVNIMLAWNGCLGISPYYGITSPAYCVYRVKDEFDLNREYFGYLFSTALYKGEFKKRSTGIIESRLRLYSDDLFRMFCFVPPKDEQDKIVRLIHTESAKITRFIQTKQRFIELLKEQRQSIITHAVTKGIEEKVKMKETGIEWIRQVPEHWEIRRIKSICNLRSGENITAESIHQTGVYPVYGGNGLRGYTSTFTNEGEYILIGRQGALCGNINYTSGTFWASEHAVVVYPKIDLIMFWFGEVLRTMNLNQYSMAAAQPGLAIENIRVLPVPYPPTIEEQKSIVEHIRIETKTLDIAISKAEREIELIKEYREAMIAEAVTGKMKL